MFRNGVEIMSNQSGDSIRYGTLKDIEVQNGGQNFDVLFPPNIHIDDSVGAGATYAIVENGKFESIEVLSGGYDIEEVPNVVITGGNGTGAVDPVARLKEVKTSRDFNPDTGVDLSNNTITFINRPLFENGESVYYKKSYWICSSWWISR